MLFESLFINKIKRGKLVVGLSAPKETTPQGSIDKTVDSLPIWKQIATTNQGVDVSKYVSQAIKLLKTEIYSKKDVQATPEAISSYVYTQAPRVLGQYFDITSNGDAKTTQFKLKQGLGTPAQAVKPKEKKPKAEGIYAKVGISYEEFIKLPEYEKNIKPAVKAAVVKASTQEAAESFITSDSGIGALTKYFVTMYATRTAGNVVSTYIGEMTYQSKPGVALRGKFRELINSGSWNLNPELKGKSKEDISAKAKTLEGGLIKEVSDFTIFDNTGKVTENGLDTVREFLYSDSQDFDTWLKLFNEDIYKKNTSDVFNTQARLATEFKKLFDTVINDADIRMQVLTGLKPSDITYGSKRSEFFMGIIERKVVNVTFTAENKPSEVKDLVAKGNFVGGNGLGLWNITLKSESNVNTFIVGTRPSNSAGRGYSNISVSPETPGMLDILGEIFTAKYINRSVFESSLVSMGNGGEAKTEKAKPSKLGMIGLLKAAIKSIKEFIFGEENKTEAPKEKTPPVVPPGGTPPPTQAFTKLLMLKMAASPGGASEARVNNTFFRNIVDYIMANVGGVHAGAMGGGKNPPFADSFLMFNPGLSRDSAGDETAMVEDINLLSENSYKQTLRKETIDPAQYKSYNITKKSPVAVSPGTEATTEAESEWVHTPLVITAFSTVSPEQLKNPKTMSIDKEYVSMRNIFMSLKDKVKGQLVASVRGTDFPYTVTYAKRGKKGKGSKEVANLRVDCVVSPMSGPTDKDIAKSEEEYTATQENLIKNITGYIHSAIEQIGSLPEDEPIAYKSNMNNNRYDLAAEKNGYKSIITFVVDVSFEFHMMSQMRAEAAQSKLEPGAQAESSKDPDSFMEFKKASDNLKYLRNVTLKSLDVDEGEKLTVDPLMDKKLFLFDAASKAFEMLGNPYGVGQYSKKYSSTPEKLDKFMGDIIIPRSDIKQVMRSKDAKEFIQAIANGAAIEGYTMITGKIQKWLSGEKADDFIKRLVNNYVSSRITSELQVSVKNKGNAEQNKAVSQDYQAYMEEFFAHVNEIVRPAMQVEFSKSFDKATEGLDKVTTGNREHENRIDPVINAIVKDYTTRLMAEEESFDLAKKTENKMLKKDNAGPHTYLNSIIKTVSTALKHDLGEELRKYTASLHSLSGTITLTPQIVGKHLANLRSSMLSLIVSHLSMNKIREVSKRFAPANKMTEESSMSIRNILKYSILGFKYAIGAEETATQDTKAKQLFSSYSTLSSKELVRELATAMFDYFDNHKDGVVLYAEIMTSSFNSMAKELVDADIAPILKDAMASVTQNITEKDIDKFRKDALKIVLNDKRMGTVYNKVAGKLRQMAAKDSAAPVTSYKAQMLSYVDTLRNTPKYTDKPDQSSTHIPVDTASSWKEFMTKGGSSMSKLMMSMLPEFNKILSDMMEGLLNSYLTDAAKVPPVNLLNKTVNAYGFFTGTDYNFEEISKIFPVDAMNVMTKVFDDKTQFSSDFQKAYETYVRTKPNGELAIKKQNNVIQSFKALNKERMKEISSIPTTKKELEQMRKDNKGTKLQDLQELGNRLDSATVLYVGKRTGPNHAIKHKRALESFRAELLTKYYTYVNTLKDDKSNMSDLDEYLAEFNTLYSIFSTSIKLSENIIGSPQYTEVLNKELKNKPIQQFQNFIHALSNSTSDMLSSYYSFLEETVNRKNKKSKFDIANQLMGKYDFYSNNRGDIVALFDSISKFGEAFRKTGLAKEVEFASITQSVTNLIALRTAGSESLKRMDHKTDMLSNITAEKIPFMDVTKAFQEMYKILDNSIDSIDHAVQEGNKSNAQKAYTACVLSLKQAVKNESIRELLKVDTDLFAPFMSEVGKGEELKKEQDTPEGED